MCNTEFFSYLGSIINGNWTETMVKYDKKRGWLRKVLSEINGLTVSVIEKIKNNGGIFVCYLKTDCFECVNRNHVITFISDRKIYRMNDKILIYGYKIYSQSSFDSFV